MATLGYRIMEELYLLDKQFESEQKYEISIGVNVVIDWVDDRLKGAPSYEYYDILTKMIKDCYVFQSEGKVGFKECVPILVKYKDLFEL